MKSDEEIRNAVQRTKKALHHRPALGQSTIQTTARLGNGLACTVREDDCTLDMDVPETVGGGDSAPSPGVYGRAALAGCLAIGIKTQAAEAGVPIESLAIDLESDCDDRGEFGIDEVPPGFEEFRVQVRIKSTASEDDVRGVVQRELEVSPWLAVFARPHTVCVDVSVEAGAVAPSAQR